MKYNYKFRILQLSYKKKLLIELPHKIELVSTFLESDIQGNPYFAMELIEKILTSKSDYEEFNGNICGLEIRKEKTLIFNNLAEDNMGNWCIIETDELKNLINIWTEHLKKFKETSFKYSCKNKKDSDF